MSRPALVAGANFAQPLPGIDPQFMAVIPFEFEGVLTDSLGGERFHTGFEHWELAGLGVSGLPGLASGFSSFFIAQSARTRVP